tara:strand:+ start:32290 stop:33402 length:1113 start_codon:yes stop_codon:yes gene_type:complete
VSDLAIPLFVTARRKAGGIVHMLLKAGVVADSDGPFQCHASAPNGREAEGTVQRLDYHEVRQLFEKTGDLNLVVDRGRFGAGKRLKSVGLNLWSAGKVVDAEKGQIELAQGPPGAAHLRIAQAAEAPINHVQVWSTPGAVMVSVWPVGGTLFPLPGLPDVQRRVRPVILGPDLQCSSYWGFYRHSMVPAVRQLGAELLEKALDPKAKASEDELLVASHYALNFLPPSPGQLGPLASRLSACSGSDAAIMSWSIGFDAAETFSQESPRVTFERAILALAGKGCLYTEVFRMLIQRLGEAEEIWRDEPPGQEPPSADVETAIQWAKQLATATYWDAEHLTYRALDPCLPNAHATSDQLVGGAKKKCVILPLK